MYHPLIDESPPELLVASMFDIAAAWDFDSFPAPLDHAVSDRYPVVWKAHLLAAFSIDLVAISVVLDCFRMQLHYPVHLPMFWVAVD